MKMKVDLFLYLILIIPLIVNCYSNETFKSKWSDSLDNDNQAWSKLLEEYTISKTNRMSRMEGPYRYIPTSDLYIRRIGEAAPTEQIQQHDFNQQYSQHQQPYPRPMTLQQNTMQHRQELLGHQQNNVQQQQPMMGLPQPMTIQPRIETNRQNYLSSPLMNHNPQFNGPSTGFHQSQQQQQRPPLREVSETDLYLLGAIEKLVYRVDYLENRVRRTEQLIYYLMAGNNENRKEVAVDDPCPKNFTKIGETCYYISDQRLNWKSANQICKSMSSHLAEFESITENEEIVAYLLNHAEYRSKDFWLGGLNPGLLWIWSNSAKPVNPNLNLANLTNANKNQSQSNSTEPESQNKIINNANEIKGNGRCLRLSYNSIKHTYHYYGQECTSRNNFLCEFEDRTTENQIKKIGKALNIF